MVTLFMAWCSLAISSRVCHPQRGVEVGERLVEEEDPRVAHDGAADRHALALAAGELLRQAVEQVVDLQQLRRLLTRALISSAPAFCSFMPKAMLS